MLSECLKIKTKIKSALDLQIKPQSAKEIINSIVDIGGTMKGGVSTISFVSLAIGAAGAGAILIPPLIITHNENKTLKEQNKELKQKILKNNIQGEVNEQKV